LNPVTPAGPAERMTMEDLPHLALPVLIAIGDADSIPPTGCSRARLSSAQREPRRDPRGGRTINLIEHNRYNAASWDSSRPPPAAPRERPRWKVGSCSVSPHETRPASDTCVEGISPVLPSTWSPSGSGPCCRLHVESASRKTGTIPGEFKPNTPLKDRMRFSCLEPIRLSRLRLRNPKKGVLRAHRTAAYLNSFR